MKCNAILDCSDEFNALNFQAVKYVDEKGEKRPMHQTAQSSVRRHTMNDFTEIIQFLFLIALLLVAFSFTVTL